MEANDDATSDDRTTQRTRIGQSVHSLRSCLDRIDDCFRPESGSQIRNLHLQRLHPGHHPAEQPDDLNERQPSSAGAGSMTHEEEP